MTPARARKIVRRRADGTQEIEASQILIETYLEDIPPPPPTKPSPRASRASLPPPLPTKRPTKPPTKPASLAQADVAGAYASVPGLDLRTSAPSFTTEAESVAPVALASRHDAAPASTAPPSFAAVVAPRKGSPLRGALLVGAGVMLGGLLTFAIAGGGAARVAALARGLGHRPAAAAAPAPASPTPVVQAASSESPSAAASADAPPTISVDALPKAKIGAKMTLVTLPSRARGHRVYVDNKELPDAISATPMACGRHVVRIGTHGKAQKLDFPCGGELTVR